MEAALNQLADLNRMKANIVANISHELRTPMTHIKGYLELVDHFSNGADNRGSTECVKSNGKGIQPVGKINRGPSPFSESDRAEVALNLQPTDLHHLGQTLVNRAQFKPKKNIFSLAWFQKSDCQKLE